MKDTDHLHDIDGYLLDMDGTIYLGDRLFPFAVPFIECLRARSKKWLWLTNNCSKSPKDYVAKLHRLGIDAKLDEIFTSGHATIAFLDSQKPGARLFVLGTSSFEGQLREAGFVLTADRPDYVLASFDLTLTYEKLRTACELIQQGVPFVSSHPDKVCPTETWFIPDSGAICAAITAATGVEPRYFGKPYKEMVDGALGRLGTPGERTAMIGDRLYTDMMMAKNAGITSILVLTGETKQEHLADSPIQPDYVLPSLAELTAVLQGANAD